MFSPDGRWLAYASDESGGNEVWVRPFPGQGTKWQISRGGAGIGTLWSRTRNELFYMTPGQQIMVVSYAVDHDVFLADQPQLWSDAFHAASETNEHRLAPRRRPFCGCCGCRGRGRSESGQAGVRLQFLRRAAAHCTCSKELRPTARTTVPLAILSYLIFRRRRGCSLDPLRSSRIVYRPIESLASLFKT
jgi:hypothetical protein